MRIFTEHRGFWLLAGLTFLGHSLLMAVPPLNSDEAFMWEWSRHLALGYYSHPPMTAWVVAAVTALFGTAAYSVRLGALLLHLGTTALVYRIARELAPGRPMALTAAALYVLMPVSLLLGTMAGTDMGLIFWWSATAWLVKRAVIDGESRLWYAAGVCAGGMLLSKFFAVLFFPGLLAFLLWHPAHRRQLARREPWLAALIALAVFSPFLYWNATHRWLTFQFNLMNRQGATGLGWEKPLLYLAGQMLAASPLVLWLLVAALAAVLVAGGRRLARLPAGGAPTSLAARGEDALLFYGVQTAVPLAIFAVVSLSAKVGAHWAAVVYPTGAVVLAAWLNGLAGASPAGDADDTTGTGASPRLVRTRWAAGAWVSLAATSLPIAVVLLAPTVLPARYLYFDEARGGQQPVAQYYGWREVGLRIDALRREHGSQPGGLFLSTRDYSDASLFDFYTPGHADFVLMGYRAEEFHGKEFLTWGRTHKRRGANTLFVLDSPIFPDNLQRLAPYFREVRPLEPLEIRDGEGRLLRRFHFALGIDYLDNEPERLSRW